MQFTKIQAEIMYKNDPKLKPSDVQILLDWLKTQRHLPEIDESQAIVFFHSCYYNIEATKKTLDSYFTRRTKHPEIFNSLTEDVLRQTLTKVFFNTLPKFTEKGYIVVSTKLMNTSLENYSFLNAIKLVHMAEALAIHKYGAVRGLICIFDSKGFSISHLTRFNFSALKYTLEHVQEGIPVRIKTSHFVNMVPFMDKIVSLVKPLLHPKVFESIKFHSSFDTLYEYVPKDCLPADYGGDLPSCDQLQEENLQEFLNNLDFFKWHDSQLVDESKRMEKNKVDDSFGMAGTFKKLALD